MDKDDGRFAGSIHVIIEHSTLPQDKGVGVGNYRVCVADMAAMIAATVASGCSIMLGCDPGVCEMWAFARSAILS
jgi:hypothetical protein